MSRELRQLLADLQAKQTQSQALMSKEGVSAEDLNTALAEVKAIKAKIEMQKAIDEGKSFNDQGVEVVPAPAPAPSSAKEDKFASLEYRQAFMDYAMKGKSSSVLEFRSLDTATTTTDAAAVIPSTILNEVIKKVESYGQIFARVRKMAVKGGVTVPILALKPGATWIGETTVSDKQKVDLSANISFSYFGLECKIATSILADTVTIDQFESIIINLIGEAMTKALDIAIVSGAGSASPKGITVDNRVPAGQIVTLSSGDFVSWEAWKKKIFAKMPMSYKGGATFLMASGTFEGYIDGMTDAQGQPIGRVNYGITAGPQESFGGKTVIEVEDDVINNYDDAANGDCCGDLL